MNRFAALDIDEYEEEGNAPDQSERDRELAENIAAARAAGLGPQLDDLEKLRALQRITGAKIDVETDDFPYAVKPIGRMRVEDREGDQIQKGVRRSRNADGTLGNLYSYDDPKVKAEIDALYAKTELGDLKDNDSRNWGTVKIGGLKGGLINIECGDGQHSVQWLQQLLNSKTKRAKLPVDGILGPHTLAMAVRKKIWTTKDGETLAIMDMSDTHLLNAARMLMRGDRADRDVMLRVFEYEANRRGRLL